ncbi:hypothetical protein PBCVNEJV1_302L [Paramecium bursaria Chlorella virus NE-JV-1]|nr:hypothetical protein PBCVNEJV1_302L [Paramecium bursaria Chlorella virus NE-JV-1]
MTSFYYCACGYSTKNEEYANFHKFNDCKAFKFDSAFEGLGGLIFLSKNDRSSIFGKWFGTTEALEQAFADHDLKYRYFDNCDRAFSKLQTKARNQGLVSNDSPSLIVRNDSADQLFEDFA